MHANSSRLGSRFGRSRSVVIGAVGVTAVAATFGGPGAASGQKAAGLTSYAWTLTPAGHQTALSDFPMNGVLTPDGNFLVVANSGQGTESLQVVRLADSSVVQTVPQPQQGEHPAYFYNGLAFDDAGKTLYVSTSAPFTPPNLPDTVRAYSVSEKQGSMTLIADPTHDIQLPTGVYPAGLAVHGTALYVAENIAGGVTMIDLTGANAPKFHATGTSVSSCTSQSPVPPGQLTCPYPLSMTLNNDGSKLVVTNQGESSVSIVDFVAGTVRDLAVGLHPNAVTLDRHSGRVFVSNGDGESISVIGADLTKVERTISVRPFDGAQPGANPDAIAVSRNGKTLYVAEAGQNAIAVVDIAGHDARVKGLIPTAWFPTTVLLTEEDDALLVLNAKGLGSAPNPGYVQGTYGPEGQYVGNMMHGTLSTIDVPDGDELADDTAQVAKNNRFPGSSNNGADKASVIPRSPGRSSPVKHVVFILKENRTFDQVFGDLGNGSNGDPSLTMFGQQVTPNLHALAHQFVTLDNFFADAEVSTQGHNWATQAQANDYTEVNWLNDYTDWGQRGYDFEGTNTATTGPAGFLWNDAQRAGISFQNNGEFVSCVQATSPPSNCPSNPNKLKGLPQWVANDPSLEPYTNPRSSGFTFVIPDIKTPKGPDSPLPIVIPTRFDAWNAQFQAQMAASNPDTAMPTMTFLRLPNDHTQGALPGALTAKADVAQNDYAVGKVVETISHSPVWADTAIFITEDDAQDGPDHLDAHRTEALVISPYTEKSSPGAADRIDSTRYDTVSMLKTMELITGMQPMSQFDAAATPMLATFNDGAVLTPYTALPPDPSIDGSVTAAAAVGAAESSSLDFTTADAAPSSVVNRIIWEATMPGRAYPPTPGAHG